MEPKTQKKEIETNRQKLREESEAEAIRQQTEEMTKTEKPQPEPPAKPIFQIDPKMAKLAKQMGIPIDKIIDYAQMQDARLQNLEKAVVAIATQVDASDKKLAPLVNAIEQAQAARQQAAANPTAGGNPMPQGDIGIGSLLQLLPQILGGGGVDEEMRALNKRMMEMSLQRMQSDIGFTEAIKNAMVTKIAGKAAADLV